MRAWTSSAGRHCQGLWELWTGTLAIFVGLYLLGYRSAWPALDDYHRL